MEHVDIPFCVSPAGCSQMVVYPCLTVFACADILRTSLLSESCVKIHVHIFTFTAGSAFIHHSAAPSED